MAEAKLGVKDFGEFIDGAEAIGVILKKVLKDGKINQEDIPHALELIQAQPKILAMIDGLGNIPAEAKDLNLDEAQLVLAKLVGAIKKVKAA